MLLVHNLAVAAVEVTTEADGDWRARLWLLVERAIIAPRTLAAIGFTKAPTGPISCAASRRCRAYSASPTKPAPGP
ncbi:hypothetical protein F5X71_28550 [Nocardia brasiliensis]|uniref:Uncharacterized protein n=1 Tax=Nocardia brasiliensis TaxID=37326 RepID=A0A6G9XXY2_NOCBR|nr:hypothetical protein [Nocardia brasiliensis]QIS05730.1 hypothetical protein F5X71_28550 [Nocardia brasiliensis]